jgi:hypothetical protein
MIEGNIFLEDDHEMLDRRRGPDAILGDAGRGDRHHGREAA